MANINGCKPLVNYVSMNPMYSKKLLFAFFVVFFAVSSAVAEEVHELKAVFPPHAIINASYKGDERMVREILAAGVDKNVRDAIGETALHVAMFQPNIAVVKLLLDYGFDPNAVTIRNGYTPLHNAVAANNMAGALLLIQYGASKKIRCLEGYTPLDMAIKRDKGAIVKILY